MRMRFIAFVTFVLLSRLTYIDRGSSTDKHSPCVSTMKHKQWFHFITHIARWISNFKIPSIPCRSVLPILSSKSWDQVFFFLFVVCIAEGILTHFVAFSFYKKRRIIDLGNVEQLRALILSEPFLTNLTSHEMKFTYLYWNSDS